MNPEQRQQLNPRHQPETASTASLQIFEDPEAGLPVHSSLVQAREHQRHNRPVNHRPTPPGTNLPNQG
jgi:hypothetical protein